MRPPEGWPFLVGAGRRRDYSVLLAPDFLVTGRAHGLLNDIVTPQAVDAPPRVMEAATGTGPIGIAYVTRLVTEADIGDPRDEHGRPLRLIYGFVCRDGRIGAPAGADLDAARTAALDVYRRFLDDEDHFTTVPSMAFPLRSIVTAPPRPATAHPAAVRRPPPSPGPPRPAIWAGSAAVVTAVVVTLLLLANTGSDDNPGQHNPPTPTPSTTTTP